MKTALWLHQKLVNFCSRNADEATVVKYARYFKEGYNAWGVPSGIYQQEIKQLKSDPEITLALVLETAPLLLESGKYEETSFAISLAALHKKEFTTETFNDISRWFAMGIQNWAHCDLLCGEITPLFFIKDVVPLQALASWRTSPHKFQRRAVPVTLIKVLKHQKTLLPELLPIIAPLMLDKERVVHQGVGWFLREAWKIEPAPVEEFLLMWKESAARLIFQYATEKMTKEERNQFKRERKQ